MYLFERLSRENNRASPSLTIYICHSNKSCFIFIIIEYIKSKSKINETRLVGR